MHSCVSVHVFVCIINIIHKNTHHYYLIIVVHSYQLCPREHALSVTSCPLGGSESDPHAVYYIVGTAFVDPTSKEPNQGRVLVLEVTEGQLASEELALHISLFDYETLLHVLYSRLLPPDITYSQALTIQCFFLLIRSYSKAHS